MTMTTYIGVKSIEAKPMTFGEYNTYRGWPIPAHLDPQRPGYLVRYTDGYESWSPKEAFETAYFAIAVPNKLSPSDIDRFVGNNVETSTVGPKSTMVHVTMRNGWEDYEVSSCVDPANYDEAVGKDCALECVKHRLWKHLGFVLQWARHGLKQA